MSSVVCDTGSNKGRWKPVGIGANMCQTIVCLGIINMYLIIAFCVLFVYVYAYDG